MPVFLKHSSALAALADMAAGAGQDRTLRQNLDDNLRVGAFDLHAQQVADAQRRADQEAEVQALQMILTDQRQRDLAGQRADAQLGVADLNGQYRRDNTDAQIAGKLAGIDRQQAGAGERNAASIASREGIAAANREALGQRLERQIGSREDLSVARFENQQRLAELRTENQRQALAQRQARNPAAYNAVAAHARDIVAQAQRHEYGIRRQLENVQQQLAALPGVGQRAQAERQRLNEAARQLIQDHQEARTEYARAIQNADQLRTQAAQQQQQAPAPVTPPPGGAGYGYSGMPSGVIPPVRPPAAPSLSNLMGAGAAGFRPLPQGEPLQVLPPVGPDGTSPGPIRVSTREEALSLPPGTPFIDPDGVPRVRP